MNTDSYIVEYCYGAKFDSVNVPRKCHFYHHLD